MVPKIAGAIMTTIKASCPTCQEVELTSADVEFRTCRKAELSFYAFTCPKCQERVQKPATAEVINLLRSGGVIELTLVIPLEFDESEAMTGPRFTYDDLLDLHGELSLLDEPGWERALDGNM
ncbi:MAG: hypothetical protein ACRD3W_25435 [Terriglobales bacterium]